MAEAAGQQGLVGNLIGLLSSIGLPLLLLGGLFFLFGRRGGGAGGGGSPFGGGPGGMNPFEFSKSQSKFNEVPNTGVTFDDVAVRLDLPCPAAWLTSLQAAAKFGAGIKDCCAPSTNYNNGFSTGMCGVNLELPCIDRVAAHCMTPLTVATAPVKSGVLNHLSTAAVTHCPSPACWWLRHSCMVLICRA